MTRNIKELKEARRLVTQAHRVQRQLKLTNRQFVALYQQHGGRLNLRTYGNWLAAHGNLPRESAFRDIRETLVAIVANEAKEIPAEPAQNIAQPQASVEITAAPEPVPA